MHIRTCIESFQARFYNLQLYFIPLSSHSPVRFLLSFLPSFFLFPLERFTRSRIDFYEGYSRGVKRVYKLYSCYGFVVTIHYASVSMNYLTPRASHLVAQSLVKFLRLTSTVARCRTSSLSFFFVFFLLSLSLSRVTPLILIN